MNKQYRTNTFFDVQMSTSNGEFRRDFNKEPPANG